MSEASLYEIVLSYLEERQWPVSPDPDASAVAFPVTGRNGSWLGFARTREKERQVLVHSVLPQTVPEDRREAMMAFVTRANFGTVIGNFELDLDAGELRYKTSIDVEGATFEPSLLGPLLVANMAMVDRYMPGITSVLGGGNPTQAIREIEDP